MILALSVCASKSGVDIFYVNIYARVYKREVYLSTVKENGRKFEPNA